MSHVHAYYYLTKPGIVYGNIMTAAAGFLLAAEWQIDFGLFLAAIGGIALVIASACVFNNYLDRRIDAKMTRTQKRALASGTIPTHFALLYGVVLGLAGFGLLAAWVNGLTVILGAIAFIDYIVLYGLAKRHSVYGTLVGTIAGSMPLAAGYVAVTNNFDVTALLLFLVMFAWQMAHFYAIAIYRLKDYAAANIPVFPVKRGIPATQIHILVYIVTFVLCTSLLTILDTTGYTFMIVMALVGAWWFDRTRQERHRLTATPWAKAVFGRSLFVLLLLSTMLSVGSLLP